MPSYNMSDLFFNQGNRQAIEEVKCLRLAQITSVDTTNMVCSLNILDRTSTRTIVPLPMPMAYPGGGIFMVPTVGTHVVVGIRSMQMPLVLGYYPFNTMAPDSYYQMFKQVYGMPEDLAEGELMIRTRGDSAKCLQCGTISLLTAWTANISVTTLIDQCPHCQAPAFVMDPATQLPLPGSLNKQVLGSTLRMTAQAELSYMADNLMSAENGDTTNILELYVNGKTGDMTVANANDVSIEAAGDFFVKCKNYTVNADNAITEITKNKNFDTRQAIVENAQDRTFNAVNSLNFVASSLNDTISGLVSQKMASRALSINNSDTYETSSATVYISGDLLGNGRLTQIGTAKNSVPDQMILYGNEFKNIYGDSTVEVVGDISTSLLTGDYELMAMKGHVSIAAVTGTLNLSGSQMVLNAWAPGPLGYKGQGVARVADSVVSDTISDPNFWLYLNAVSKFLATFATDTPPAFAASKPLAAAAAALMPSALKSLITSGNTTVLA